MAKNASARTPTDDEILATAGLLALVFKREKVDLFRTLARPVEEALESFGAPVRIAVGGADTNVDAAAVKEHPLLGLLLLRTWVLERAQPDDRFTGALRKSLVANRTLQRLATRLFQWGYGRAPQMQILIVSELTELVRSAWQEYGLPKFEELVDGFSEIWHQKENVVPPLSEILPDHVADRLFRSDALPRWAGDYWRIGGQLHGSLSRVLNQILLGKAEPWNASRDHLRQGLFASYFEERHGMSREANRLAVVRCDSRNRMVARDDEGNLFCEKCKKLLFCKGCKTLLSCEECKTLSKVDHDRTIRRTPGMRAGDRWVRVATAHYPNDHVMPLLVAIPLAKKQRAELQRLVIGAVPGARDPASVREVRDAETAASQRPTLTELQETVEALSLLRPLLSGSRRVQLNETAGLAQLREPLFTRLRYTQTNDVTGRRLRGECFATDSDGSWRLLAESYDELVRKLGEVTTAADVEASAKLLAAVICSFVRLKRDVRYEPFGTNGCDESCGWGGRSPRNLWFRKYDLTLVGADGTAFAAAKLKAPSSGHGNDLILKLITEEEYVRFNSAASDFEDDLLTGATRQPSVGREYDDGDPDGYYESVGVTQESSAALVAFLESVEDIVERLGRAAGLSTDSMVERLEAAFLIGEVVRVLRDHGAPGSPISQPIPARRRKPERCE